MLFYSSGQIFNTLILECKKDRCECVCERVRASKCVQVCESESERKESCWTTTRYSTSHYFKWLPSSALSADVSKSQRQTSLITLFQKLLFLQRQEHFEKVYYPYCTASTSSVWAYTSIWGITHYISSTWMRLSVQALCLFFLPQNT